MQCHLVMVLSGLSGIEHFRGAESAAIDVLAHTHARFQKCKSFSYTCLTKPVH